MHKLAFFKVVNFEKIPLLEACFMSPMAELVEMTEKVVTVPLGASFSCLKDSRVDKKSNFEAQNM